jgi:hypothetical protein
VEDDKKIVINVADGKEISIREGKLADQLPVLPPEKIHLSGDIMSIANYLAVRKDNAEGIQVVDIKKVVVEVNKTALQIVMKLDPESAYGATVTAKLEMAPEVKQFNINATTRYNRKQLHDLLKFNRIFFSDRNVHNTVLAGLAKVRFLTAAEIDQASDNKGNRQNSVKVETTADGFTDRFTLSIPLFKGFDKENVEIEICYDTKDGEISFWLESVGMKEVMDTQVDRIFEKALECCDGFVVIHK